MDPLIIKKTQLALKQLIEQRILLLQQQTLGDELISLSFEAPNKAFTGQLNTQTTINCYLFALREDKTRRQSDPKRKTRNERGTAFIAEREPRYVELHYMLTVWTQDEAGSAELEHIVLGYLLSGLGAIDFMPETILADQGLVAPHYGIRFTLFGSDQVQDVGGQIWQALGTTPKPSLMLSLSLPVQVAEQQILPITEALEANIEKI